jgi:2-octaprenyl-6-methoxyphenol hydroxylase
MPAVFDQRNLSFAAATVNALGALGMRRWRMPDGPIRASTSAGAAISAGAAGGGRYGPWNASQVVARDFGDALAARLDELVHLTRYRPARFAGWMPGDGLAGASHGPTGR